MKKNSIFLILVLIFGISLEIQAAQKKQPPKTAPKEQPKMGGTLVVGLGKALSNPNPFVSTSSTNRFVREASYESLLTQDDDGKIVPNLAMAYEVSSGGTVFTLHLRKGVKFHNGQEMKADDVIWSANHVKDPRNGAYGQNILTKDLKSFEKIDDYTVKFTLLKPSVTFLFHLSTIQMLPILPVSSLKPGQIKLGKDAFVPGTGPFILEQFQPGFDMVLKKHPEYWGVPAYLDKIIIRPIADNDSRFNALRTGDVQVAERLGVLDAARIKKGDVKGVKVLEEPLGGYQQICFNYKNPLFQKLEMRQAVSYATDKQRLVDEVYFGHAMKTDLMMDSQDIWSKAADLSPHKRDLVKAKALLKVAGYSGQELVLIGQKASAQSMESFQRMLGEAGIKVKLEILEGGVYSERFIAGKYDLIFDGSNITGEPIVTMSPDYYTNKVYPAQYSNPKVDQLFDSLDKEFDKTKRLKIFKELAWMLHNDVASLPLFFEFRYLGLSEKVQGFGPPPGYSYSESGEYFRQAWLI